MPQIFFSSFDIFCSPFKTSDPYIKESEHSNIKHRQMIEVRISLQSQPIFSALYKLLFSQVCKHTQSVYLENTRQKTFWKYRRTAWSLSIVVLVEA